MSDDILSRLAAVESRLSEILPALERRHGVHAPAAWLRDRIANRAAELRRGRVAHVDITISGDIDEAMANRVRDEVEEHCLATSLTLNINTMGGEYGPAVRIFRSVHWHAAVMKTARLGKACMSAGVIVALAADRRIASAETEILLHGVGGKPDHREHWSVARHIQEIRRLRELDIEMLNLIADRTNANLAALAAESSTEDYLPLEQALAFGLIHEVAP